MIEVTGIKLHLSQLDGTHDQEMATLRKAILRRLRVKARDIASLELRKRSIDARRKSDVVLTYTVWLTLAGGDSAEGRLLANLAHHRQDRGVRRFVPEPPAAPSSIPHPRHRPVVVGAGCAGLFCALELAEAGLEPLLVERGDDAEARTLAIARFNQTGVLDPQSNIQFGLGGAGTFSDGKLSTGTKSPVHRKILETLVEAGAQPQILWDAKPHVGSDVLPKVVGNVAARIRELGGEVRFRCQMTDVVLDGGRVAGVELSKTLATGKKVERIATDHLVLACGHSARDVFELLAQRDVTLERKTFAMGVRIEHLQANVDRALFGPSAGHASLGAAPYKLVAHLDNDRSAFSFCMCPGGYVVAAASEEGGVVTNGMSLSDRAGTNSNSGLLANVFPTDLPGDDPLEGVRLQRTCERRAFELGGGGYAAPAQLVGDFLQNAGSSAGGGVIPTYPRGVAWGKVDDALPGYVTETLRAAIPQMDRRLHGFASPDAVLTGVETRSSSPVRVTRDDRCQSVSTPGLWPCGEGAGYAGGIMSAATDGINCARALISSLREDA